MPLRKLFRNNRNWAAAIKAETPSFFETLAAQQSPRFLWIGCSDSRVPANEIVGMLPGELFVHRNVANLVQQTDLNCLSVVQYAVDVLKVNQIIVCGHYGCGGIRAALGNADLGLIDNWLHQVRDIAKMHNLLLNSQTDEDARVNKLCELNVLEQAVHLSQCTLVRKAWARNQPLTVHSCIYGIHDGILRDVGYSISDPGEAESLYERALRRIVSSDFSDPV